MKRAWTGALVAGVALGLLVPAVAFGVGATHVVCVVGGVTGWSGPLASPVDIALAPPGGYETYSWSLATKWSSTDWTGTSGSSSLLANWSRVDFYYLNWTYQPESSRLVPGWGSTHPCSGLVRASDNAAGVPFGGCGACVIANATPAGVGQRLNVPQPANSAGTLLANVNLSYASSPVGSVDFEATSAGGLQWSESPAVRGLPITTGPFYENGQLFGLAITLTQDELAFGVPIHFLNGSNKVLPTSLPNGWPIGPAGATILQVVVTYILPVSSGQGSWSVYLAGPGPGVSAGGLLFEQMS